MEMQRFCGNVFLYQIYIKQGLVRMWEWARNIVQTTCTWKNSFCKLCLLPYKFDLEVDKITL